MYHGFAGHGLMTGYSWGGIGMGIVSLFFVVFAIVWFVRSGHSRRNGSDTQNGKGLEILEERFARGEITPELFCSMKAELTANSK